MTVRGLDDRPVFVADALVGSRVARALDGAAWPGEGPFSQGSFRRWDESSDASFYGEPQLQEHHLDAGALAALQGLYASLLAGAPPGLAILDVGVLGQPLAAGFAARARRGAGHEPGRARG